MFTLTPESSRYLSSDLEDEERLLGVVASILPSCGLP